MMPRFRDADELLRAPPLAELRAYYDAITPRCRYYAVTYFIFDADTPMLLILLRLLMLLLPRCRRFRFELRCRRHDADDIILITFYF